MAVSALVDAGFIVALLHSRDQHHAWAVAQAERFAPPWTTCEAALSESFHLLSPGGAPALIRLLSRRAVILALDLGRHMGPVLNLLRKYSDVPISLADACLVRLSETLGESVLLTTDGDFRIYRRHGRQVIPCVMPD
jgi:predicted nucleic acid-binding protein